MIPGPVCSHYWPRLKRACDAGLRAPHDCDGCPAYYDGSDFLGLSPEDDNRRDGWRATRERSLPHAHFRAPMEAT